MWGVTACWLPASCWTHPARYWNLDGNGLEKALAVGAPAAARVVVVLVEEHDPHDVDQEPAHTRPQAPQVVGATGTGGGPVVLALLVAVSIP